jgi:hypothetical protein
MMHRDGWAGKKGNSGMAFGWFVFERDHRGPPTIHRISWDRPEPPRPSLSLPANKEAEMAKKTSEAAVVQDKMNTDNNETPTTIAKPPEGFNLNRFKSKRAVAMANVETLPNALPIHSIAGAKDFVRLHPDEENYWSTELCFVSVPIKGSKRDSLHLIDEDIAMRHLPSAKVLRFRLALASKPTDAFFLCQVPTRNLDNTYNASNVEACESAKMLWTQATSRREEGVEAYKVELARDADAFPPPKWPSLSFSELISKAFAGRMIDREDHPGLLRLIGAQQS